ncbi:MAG: hypothetical protein NT173_06050, partial [Opitutales bacterium]|nr:hypothetical protein [Opitutales bacterium]
QVQRTLTPTAVHYTLAGPWGTDHVHCRLTGAPASPAGEPLIHVRRSQNGRDLVLFSTQD